MASRSRPRGRLLDRLCAALPAPVKASPTGALRAALTGPTDTGERLTRRDYWVPPTGTSGRVENPDLSGVWLARSTGPFDKKSDPFGILASSVLVQAVPRLGVHTGGSTALIACVTFSGPRPPASMQGLEEFATILRLRDQS